MSNKHWEEISCKRRRDWISGHPANSKISPWYESIKNLSMLKWTFKIIYTNTPLYRCGNWSVRVDYLHKVTQKFTDSTWVKTQSLKIIFESYMSAQFVLCSDLSAREHSGGSWPHSSWAHKGLKSQKLLCLNLGSVPYLLIWTSVSLSYYIGVKQYLPQMVVDWIKCMQKRVRGT